MSKPPKIPVHLQPWIEARRKHRLSHMHVQMARELGMNPKRFGKIDNHRQQPWKAPLPNFIEGLYYKRFKRERPETIRTIEEIATGQLQKKVERKAARAAKRAAGEQTGSIAGNLRDSGMSEVEAALYDELEIPF